MEDVESGASGSRGDTWLRNVVFTLFLAVLILALVSCPNPGGSGRGAAPGAVGGSLVIKLPQIPMQLTGKGADLTAVSFYDVSGSGPGSASFQKPGIMDTSVTIDSLTPGSWAIAVNGNNINGVQVQSASAKVTVAAGQTASVDAALNTSIAGGSLALTMKWPAGFSIASVALTPQDNAQPSITVPPVAGGSSIDTTLAVPACYYILSRVFRNISTGFTSGGADAVRVASGSTTRFQLTIDSAVNVAIVPDISKTIPITFTGSKAVFGRGESPTITAQPTISKQYRSFTYQWYLNGAPLSSGSSVTIIAKDHPGGDYRLDVVVSANGMLSSNCVTFTIPGN
jgi:hypothetical protein